MAKKQLDYFDSIDVDILHIAQSFAIDNGSPKIEPAHLFRALLHKSAGLVNYIENDLDEDYYYLVDWCDIRIQQCDKSPYKMKGFDLSQDCLYVIDEAKSYGDQFDISSCKLEVLLAALVTPGVGFSAEQLKTMPLKKDKILSLLQKSSSDTKSSHNSKQTQSFVKSEVVNEYCYLMTNDILNVEIIGFENELRSFIEILARKDRANVLILGETGIGKTSLIYALIKQIVDKRIPSSLSNLVPFELDVISLAQGVSYKGEIEDRFKSVIDYISQNEQPLLVIENFHRISESNSILNSLLPHIKKILASNTIQLLCTSSIDGYTKNLEKDKELTGFFEKMSLSAPTEEQTVEILNSKKAIYEKYHNVLLDSDVVSEIVLLAKRYMPERNLPSSAIDLLDRSMASVKIDSEMNGGRNDNADQVFLYKDNIRDVVSKMTGIPMGNIQSEERQKLSNAEEILHKRVVGQNHAIKSILDAVFESRSGLNKKGQPIGSFFFLGPTGTGKTELAKSLAEFLFNDDTSILRFDMSEYKEEHSVALLYGAPPGYVGYEEGGLLVNQIRQHPYSVVLFDEIEKAHRSVFDLFLQILDEGKLHDRLGRVGDFSNALIIFTSNIGSDYIFKSFGEGRVPTHDQMLEVMQGQFRPEFLARLTEIVPFSPITSEMIDRIFDIHIQNLLKMLKEQNISLVIDETARNYITKVGFNAHYGARPILGIIRKEIRRPLSKLIISGDVNSGDTITMKYNEETNEIEWEIDTPE